MKYKMNEILFRGKRVDNGEWVYGFLRCRNYIDVWTPHTWEEDDGSKGEYSTVKSYQVNPETVGQFTGLTDKNGKKIFEGDIVKSCFRGEADKEPMTVEFRIERGGWFPFACGDGCGCCEVDTYPPEYTEVIGNIYDNPKIFGE